MLRCALFLVLLSLAATADPRPIPSPIRPTPAAKTKSVTPKVFFVDPDSGQRSSSFPAGSPFVVRFERALSPGGLLMVLIYTPEQERDHGKPAEMSAVSHSGPGHRHLETERLTLAEPGTYHVYVVDGLSGWSDPPATHLGKVKLQITR